MEQDGAILATDRLELVPRAVARELEQRGLVRGRRDARDRAELRVRDLAAAKGIVEEREVGEPVGDAEVLPRGTEAPADAPGQPVRAAPGALRVPAAAPIERAQVGQQPMQGGVEVRCLLGDPLAQRLEIFAHGQCIARQSNIAISFRLTINEISIHSVDRPRVGPARGEAPTRPTRRRRRPSRRGGRARARRPPCLDRSLACAVGYFTTWSTTAPTYWLGIVYAAQRALLGSGPLP
jgi:hypothetical protein